MTTRARDPSSERNRATHAEIHLAREEEEEIRAKRPFSLSLSIYLSFDYIYVTAHFPGCYSNNGCQRVAVAKPQLMFLLFLTAKRHTHTLLLLLLIDDDDDDDEDDDNHDGSGLRLLTRGARFGT